MSTANPTVRVIAPHGKQHRWDRARQAGLYALLGVRRSPDHSAVSGAHTVSIEHRRHDRSEDLLSVGSTAIGSPEWLTLTQRINQVFQEETDFGEALVVIGGTATLEETAYLLLPHCEVCQAGGAYRCQATYPTALRPPTAIPGSA